MRVSSLMLTVVCTAAIAHNLEPSDHFAYTEEAQYLGGNDGGSSQSFPIQVPYSGEEGLRVVGSCLRSALCSLLRGRK